jgi:exopolyphosphatase/guanosine-5'-triphosphate,3'-diphosphate pyrophosphatase
LIGNSQHGFGSYRAGHDAGAAMLRADHGTAPALGDSAFPEAVRQPQANYAALDLGTNNCRLLVARPARGGFRVIDAFSRIVRLGEGVSTTGEIISTAEEARLVVAGCAPLLHARIPYAVVFDIGGGSTEIVWLRRHGTRYGVPEILGSVSLPFGVVTFTERFGGIEVSPAIYRAMVAEAEAALQPFEREHGIRREVRARQVQMLGSSGTVTTLAGVHLALPRYIRAFVDGSMLTFDQIELVSRHLAGLDIEGRAANPCVGRERADLVLSGCAILDAICATWPVGRLRVADRGIREGILFELMQGAPE